MYKFIKFAYKINFIIMLNTKLEKKFGLKLKISQLSTYYKNQISKNTTLIILLKE